MNTGAIKNDALDAKIRLDLFPPTAYFATNVVFTYGAEKYDDWNWAKGLPYSRLYGALQRHLMAWYMGQNLDPETGFSHLWHASCNIAMLIHTEFVVKAAVRSDDIINLDDRPTKYFAPVDITDLGKILKYSPSYQALLTKESDPKKTSIAEALYPEDYQKPAVGSEAWLDSPSDVNPNRTNREIRDTLNKYYATGM